MENLILEPLNSDDLNLRFNLFFRNEGRPVRYDLFHFRTPARETGHARWSRQHQRSNLLRKSFHGLAVFAAHSDAELNFGQVRRRLTGKRTMRGVRADK